MVYWLTYLRGLLASSVVHQTLSPSPSYEYRSVQIPVSQLYDNAGTVNFDGSGGAYPVEYLPTDSLVHENIRFALPKWGNERPDNFISNNQTIPVSAGFIREFHVLYAGDWNDGESGAKFTFQFEDKNEQIVELSVKNWWNLHWLNSGPVKTPFHNTPAGRNYNITQLHHWSTTVSSFSPLKHIKFPPDVSTNRLHVFAVTLVPAYSAIDGSDGSPPAIGIKDVRLTTLKTDRGDSIVQVTLSNLRALASTSSHKFAYRSEQPLPVAAQQVPSLSSNHGDASSVLSGPCEVVLRTESGNDLRTTSPGKVFRLMPGDDARVDVGVVFAKQAGLLQVEVAVVSTRNNTPVVTSAGWSLDPSSDGKGWEPTRENLERHETPRWWSKAKFASTGVFSPFQDGPVPKGYYEEWYNWWLHNPAQPSNILWNHHRETYGEKKLYEDFIPQFDGSKFDAAQWVDLFAKAGAKYFVLVTKHHDGFALFDTHNTTHRSSVYLGPKRDFIRELMRAAKERHPDMRKGTYYSLPEWFNPDFGPYGFGRWPGHLARGAFDSSILEPYTGRLEIRDYLKDLQLDHMRILAEEYETEIMWCDIGGPNRTLEFAAEWYNKAAKLGRQVTMNNRCGAIPDFVTPEYTKFSSIQTRSWETNEGIDPYSYGYNQLTKDDEYRSVPTIISTLVDIVSKNGNYLLYLGPTGQGEIIPAMIERLVEVGEWLGHSGSCIYDTTYTFLGAELGPLRFTTTAMSFCIISLERLKNGLLVVERPVLILPGDTIVMLGAGSMGPLEWSYRDNRLAVKVSDEVLGSVKYAWAFKVNYGDVE